MATPAPTVASLDFLSTTSAAGPGASDGAVISLAGASGLEIGASASAPVGASTACSVGVSAPMVAGTGTSATDGVGAAVGVRFAPAWGLGAGDEEAFGEAAGAVEEDDDWTKAVGAVAEGFGEAAGEFASPEVAATKRDRASPRARYMVGLLSGEAERRYIIYYICTRGSSTFLLVLGRWVGRHCSFWEAFIGG
jgi:hypothetical protein